ncbi:hypothetical protein EBX31_06320 [bacterium]|nr:hypothetical protein [bacterium]
MNEGNLRIIVEELSAPPGALAGIQGSKTHTAAEIPVEFDPSVLPKECVGELLRAGERAVLGSTSKSHKSFALLHLAICKAYGLDWLGWKMAPGRVLYIDLELIPPFFDCRVAAVCRALKVPHPENLILWPLRSVRPKPKIEELVAEMVKRHKDEEVELVILEPSYKMVEPTFQGTNSEMMVAAYLEALDEIANPLKCAVITSHHSPKGDLSHKNSIDLFSGTGVWARDPDLLVTMRPHEKADHVIFDITRRHGAPVEPLVLRWDYPLHHIAHGEDPSKIRTSQSAQKAANEDRVAEVLKEAPEEGWSWTKWKDVCDEAGVSQATFDRRRKDLVDKGIVETLEGKKGHPAYRLKARNGTSKPELPF